MAEHASRFEDPVDLLERSDDLEMARCKLERHGIKRFVGKRQCMSIADLGTDRQIALASAALTLGCHVRTAIDSVNFKRRVCCEKPQRDVVRARANIEYFRSARQLPADRGDERIAPS